MRLWTFMLWCAVSKIKVQCTLVHKLRLCTGRTARRGSRGIALLFLDHGTRRGWGVSGTPQPLFNLGKIRYPMYRSLVGPRVVLERCGKSRPTGIRSPDRPARSQSLYRLRYPAHCDVHTVLELQEYKTRNVGRRRSKWMIIQFFELKRRRFI